VTAPLDLTERLISLVQLVDINVQNVLDLHSNVPFVQYQDLDFQIVIAQKVLTKMPKESVKIVQYNVKLVLVMHQCVNHVPKVES